MKAKANPETETKPLREVVMKNAYVHIDPLLSQEAIAKVKGETAHHGEKRKISLPVELWERWASFRAITHINIQESIEAFLKEFTARDGYPDHRLEHEIPPCTQCPAYFKNAGDSVQHSLFHLELDGLRGRAILAKPPEPIRVEIVIQNKTGRKVRVKRKK